MSKQIENLKPGDSVWAKDECIMNPSGKAALIVGKEYVIDDIINRSIYIKSEVSSEPFHEFPFNQIKNFFSLAPPEDKTGRDYTERMVDEFISEQVVPSPEMKTAKNHLEGLIDGIYINRANIEYILNNCVINGTLYTEIKRVCNDFAAFQTSALQQENQWLKQEKGILEMNMITYSDIIDDRNETIKRFMSENQKLKDEIAKLKKQNL